MQKIRVMGVLLLVFSLAACAGSGARSAAPHTPEDEQLHDQNLDLEFATEFPVTGKADAMARAAAAWKTGDANKALFFYVRALQFDADDPDLLTVIGGIHRLQRNAKLAVRAYSMALAIDADHFTALEGRGLILLEHGEDELAENDLTRAVGVNPDAWQSYNGLGLLADRRGNHDEAEVFYGNALRLAPQSPKILNNRGYSRYLAQNFAGAREDLLEAATRYDFKLAWINLGALYSSMAMYDTAMDYYAKILEEPVACNRVAEVAIENGDYEVAEQYLERAIRESPSYYPEAEENLIQVRQTVGR